MHPFKQKLISNFPYNVLPLAKPRHNSPAWASLCSAPTDYSAASLLWQVPLFPRSRNQEFS